MKAVVTETPISKKGMLVVTLYHKDEQLTWDVGVYDRVTFADIPTVFDPINAYWEQLPMDRQNNIWRVYQQIHETFQRGRDFAHLNQLLRALVVELYNQMPYSEMDYWVKYKAGVHIPANIPAEYNPRSTTRIGAQVRVESDYNDGPVMLPPMEMNYPKELTYLKADYLELAVLAVALRPMIPIWGEYIRQIGNIVGSNFKEYEAMDLLHDTYFHEMPAWQRLELYMQHVVKTQQNISHAMIADGLGTAMQPYWLLAGCIVRRVLFGNITSDDEKASIIANISRYVSSTTKSIDTYFGGKINKKNPPMEVNEEDNSSLADMIKIKTEINGADQETLNFYALSDMVRLDKIDPTLPVELVNRCHEFLQNMAFEELHEHQSYLIAWTCSSIIAARGIPLLGKAEVIRLMAITQATLWHWGFLDLASLVSVVRRRDATNSSMLWGNESRSRIPKDLVDELERIFPFYRQQKGKDRTVRHLNVGYRAIDLWCAMVEKYEWRLNTLPDLAEKIQTIGTSRILVIPTDIRASLAKFFIRLHTPKI